MTDEKIEWLITVYRDAKNMGYEKLSYEVLNALIESGIEITISKEGIGWRRR